MQCPTKYAKLTGQNNAMLNVLPNYKGGRVGLIHIDIFEFEFKYKFERFVAHILHPILLTMNKTGPAAYDMNGLQNLLFSTIK
jgi:hypothetical protein